MVTNAAPNYHQSSDYTIKLLKKEYAWANTSVLVGRIFYSSIFIIASINHFKSSTILYAASQGVPLPQFLVPLSGLMALIGGLSILLGYKTRVGALLIILFLIPITLTMHNFWDYSDPNQIQLQQIMFMKNLSMLGGAILLYFFGAGPVSFDYKKENDFKI
jgi:putative oxidoreductase